MAIATAVVNGSLGTIGIALVKRLLEQGKKVYAVAWPPEDPRRALLPKEAEVILCDMREIRTLTEKIPEPVDAFFHLAWMGPIGEGREDMLLQTENIRCAVEANQAACSLSAQVFVGVGSQAEYGRVEGLVKADLPCFPVSGYGMAKLCAGQMTRSVSRRLGMRHVWARVLSVFGAYDGPLTVISVILDKLLKGEKPSLTAGEQRWDYLYAEDAADALICMAEKGRDGAVYPVGSGQSRPLREYFEILRDAVDPTLPLGFGELPYPPNQIMHLQADLTPLAQDTGFTPRYTFEEAAKIVVQAFKERNRSQP